MLSFQTKLSHYRTATAVDLGEYKWYQKRAGLAGFFEFVGIFGGLHASLKAFSVKVEPAPFSGGLQAEPAPGHLIVAGFLSTRIVLAGFSSARRLA